MPRAANLSLQDNDDVSAKLFTLRMRSEPRRRKPFSRDPREYPYASLHLFAARNNSRDKTTIFSRSEDGQTHVTTTGSETIIKHALLSLHSSLLHVIKKKMHRAPTPNWIDLTGDQTNIPSQSKNPAHPSWQPGLIAKIDVSWRAHCEDWRFPIIGLLSVRSAITAFILSLSFFH